MHWLVGSIWGLSKGQKSLSSLWYSGGGVDWESGLVIWQGEVSPGRIEALRAGVSVMTLARVQKGKEERGGKEIGRGRSSKND